MASIRLFESRLVAPLQHSCSPSMFLSYLKAALRNMAKRKFFTFVNALGLSIGIALCLLIFLYIQDEYRFDTFHKNADDIVRLHEALAVASESQANVQGQPQVSLFEKSAHLPAPLLEVLKTEVPQVSMAAHFLANGPTLLRVDDVFRRANLAFVSNDFTKMFNFHMLRGDSSTALADVGSILLSQSLAEGLFGGADPIGKTVLIDFSGLRPFKVAAVVQDVPAWSSIDFEALVSIQNVPNYSINLTQWDWSLYPTFVQLHPNANRQEFQRNLDKIADRYLGEKYRSLRERLSLDGSADVGRINFLPLSDIHFADDIDWHKASNPMYMWVLAGLALVVLAVACINYLNLALASSVGRGVEIGVRKALGASRTDLLRQFYVESLLAAFFALVCSGVLMLLSLPLFNTFAGKSINWSEQDFFILSTFAAGVALLVAISAGCLPAYRISSLAPKSALYKRRSTMAVGATKYTVVAQFSVSSFLIVCAVVMFHQMDYIGAKDLGFDKENILVVRTQQPWGKDTDTFVERYRNELRKVPGVVSIGAVNIPITKALSRYSFESRDEPKYAYVFRIDPEFLEVMKLDIVKGRGFMGGSAAEAEDIVVNETLVQNMGWEDPVGQVITLAGGNRKNVVGVVKDFQFFPLSMATQPVLFNLDMGHLQIMMIRIRPGSLPGVIKDLERTWKEVEPGKPFEYSFLDEDVAAQYGDYERWTRIMGLSTFFAILIACLGLFGLAGVSAANRTKEVGIRKVLGARVWDVVYVLNRPFALMAAAAFALAAPAAQYAMARWLGQFEYAVALDWRVFAAAFAASLLLALATVSFHAFRAASVNPVETLKCE